MTNHMKQRHKHTYNILIVQPYLKRISQALNGKPYWFKNIPKIMNGEMTHNALKIIWKEIHMQQIE